MGNQKKYYWLKLKEDFFDDKVVKFLRRLPEGPSLVIIYLKMQLKSLKTEGMLKYDGILPTCEEELALVLDENPMLVTGAINALVKMGVVERWENDTLYMKAMQELIGSETAAASRVRKHRESKKVDSEDAPLLPSGANCNAEVLQSNSFSQNDGVSQSNTPSGGSNTPDEHCNTDALHSNNASQSNELQIADTSLNCNANVQQSNTDALQSNGVLQNNASALLCNTEIEIERRDRDRDRDRDRARDREEIDAPAPSESAPANSSTLHKSVSPDFGKILGLYQKLCQSLTPCTVISETAKANLTESCRVFGFGEFAMLFSRAGLNEFLQGFNEKGWKASFEWLTKLENMRKVLDGAYDRYPGWDARSGCCV